MGYAGFKFSHAMVCRTWLARNDHGALFSIPIQKIYLELTGSLFMHLNQVALNYSIHLVFLLACMV